MSALVDLNNVSIQFRRHGKFSGLKEYVLRHIMPAERSARSLEPETFWGLRDFSMHLKEGDRLGIIGPNGAGKSTLLKVISRIYTPHQGEVSVTGRIAPLIEIGAGFNPELTGRENTFLYGAILGIQRKVIAERMDAIIAFSELEKFIDTPVKYYSTGMYLRLAFTIATEIAPDILILDELYAGGDVKFIAKANKRLDKFVEGAKVLILVAHNMEYIRRFCNRVIVLSNAQMLWDGDTEEGIQRYLELQGTA